MSACIHLPTSIGEAIDKLTILDIKLERIADIARKSDVKRERDALLNHAALTDFIQTHADLYNTMKKANAIIWDMMDVLRTNISTEEYLKTCKDCIEFNDIRFRIKARINQASNSELREQKSYKTTVFRLAIIGMHETNAATVQRILKRPLQYYGILYDEVQIVYVHQPVEDASATLTFNDDDDDDDISLIMTNETQLKQHIYDALNVSDASMDKLL
jgi:hypothetical protein